MFTDLVGSTRLWERFPEQMADALARHDEIMRTTVEAHGGYVFATAGDGFAVAFQRAADAVDAAMATQRLLNDEPWPEGVVVSVRMGIHTGEAEERDGDYFGPTLNRIGRLHAVAHGGQVVVSDVTEPLVRVHVDLRDLGSHRLRDFDEAAAIFQLLGEGLRDEFPPLRTVESVAHNLPAALDGFFGRDEELRELASALRESRLVTLTGVGGTGKTRLALEAASRELGRFDDGVWLVELAALTEGSATSFVVADAVGAVQQDGRTMDESLVRSLSSRNLLLVLDNCEHLLDEVAQLVGTLLPRCPDLVLLATSREGLAVRGERILALPSLTAEEGEQLFLARAAAAGCSVGGAEITAVAEIVERLDGLPLAIELAAARTNALTIGEIAVRIDDRFRLLRGAGRGRIERQQTLWNTIAWSHDLLSPAERTVFDRLSVFAGGFTLEAAESVCASDSDRFLVEDAIVTLVERSLVIADKTPYGSRYRLLETLRQFGEAQLGEDDIVSVRNRHADWYAGFAERAYEGVGSPDGVAWNHRQLAEIDNFRQVVYGAGPDAARRVVAAMGSLWWARLDYEYVDWALRLLDHPAGDRPERATALVQGLVAAQQAGRLRDADLLRVAVDRTDDLDGVGECWWLAHVFLDAVLSGQLQMARDVPAAIVERALMLDNGFDRFTWIQVPSVFCIMAGDFATASEIWDRHVDVEARDRLPTAECNGRFFHGRYLAAVGEPGARAEFERSAELASTLEWPLIKHVALSELAAALAAEGELLAARPRLADAIGMWIQAGDLGQLWVTLHHVVDFLARVGDEALAREVWAQLGDRIGFASQAQRSALSDRFGDPPASTLSDDEMLVRSRALAGHLAGSGPTE